MTGPDRGVTWARGIILAMLGFGALAGALGFLESVDIMTTTAGCTDLDLLVSHGARRCTDADWHVRSETPIEQPLRVLVVMALALAPAPIVWWRPTIRRTLAWSIAAALTAIGYFVATYRIEIDFDRRVEHWTSSLYYLAMVMFVGLMVFQVPLRLLATRRTMLRSRRAHRLALPPRRVRR
jgi:hypothetical protein